MKGVDKILFLDVDGVLNSATWMKANPRCRLMSKGQLDPVAVQRINKVCAVTGTDIVVSSTWRLGDEKDFAKTKRTLRSAGLTPKILGRTPSVVYVKGSLYMARQRGHEIQAWLTENPQVTKFAIVDDDSDMVHLADRLVQTTWELGIQDEHVVKLIDLLK